MFTAESVWDGKTAREVADTKVSIQLVSSSYGAGFEELANLGVPGKLSHTSELAPGDHLVNVALLRASRGTYVKDATWDGQHISRGILSILPGQTSCHVRVIVGDDGAMLTAHVADKEGTPVPYSYVAIFPASAATEADMAATVIIGQADQHGFFLATMPPGKYRAIAATSVIDLAANRVSSLWGARTSGQELDVGAKAESRITLQPQPLK